MTLALVLLGAAIWLSGSRRRADVTVALAANEQLVDRDADDPGTSVPPALFGIGAGALIMILWGPGGSGLIAATVTAVVAAAMVRGRRRSVATARLAHDLGELPLFLDLVATALRAGAPMSSALGNSALLAPGSQRRGVDQVVGLLRLGATGPAAWAPLHGTALQGFAELAVRSSASGVRLAEQTGLLARDLRLARLRSIDAAAKRAGIWALAPLGLCFLPAFLCLGVLPVVIGMASAMLSG
jgi:Flp pilus assembly protein TadB